MGSLKPGRQDLTHRGQISCFFRTTTVATALTLVTLCASTVAAQSGRRSPKSTPAPAPTPQSEPVEKKTPAKEAALSLIVGIDVHDTFANIPPYFHDSVLNSCAERLRDASAVKVDAAHRDMSRADAVKVAKTEKEAYVALLQLRSDSVGAASGNVNLEAGSTRGCRANS